METSGTIHFTDGTVEDGLLLITDGMVRLSNPMRNSVVRWFPMHRIHMIIEDTEGL